MDGWRTVALALALVSRSLVSGASDTQIKSLAHTHAIGQVLPTALVLLGNGDALCLCIDVLKR